MSGGDGFTVRLNRLFETARNADGKPLTNAEIVARMTADGYGVTAGYISQLRSGLRSRPSIVHVEGLARAFGVSASYFFDEAPSGEWAGADGAVAATAEAEDHLLALRAAQLSDEGRRQVLFLIQEIERREERQRESGAK